MSTQEEVADRQTESADDRPPIRTDGGREASKLECDDDMFCGECGIMLTYYAAIVHGYDYCPECTIERVEKELFAVFGTLNSVEASHKFDVPETKQRLVTDGGVSVADLTAFQHDVLLVLADEPRYGLAIKRELQRYYGEEVNHGRLYPNLDQLVEKGLVQKKELDKRTNLYELTDAAIHALRARRDWVDERLEGSAVEQLAEARSERDPDEERDVRTDGGYDQGERKADALETIAEELAYQNAVLSEVAHAIHRVAEQSSPQPEYPSYDTPTCTRLLRNVEDHEFTREEERQR